MKKVVELLVKKVSEQNTQIKTLELQVARQEDLIKDLFYRYKEIIELIEK